jgi:hypothetical protein
VNALVVVLAAPFVASAALVIAREITVRHIDHVENDRRYPGGSW